jgi:phosphoribosylaminoimidazole-succinocarboxamide synthase
MHKVSELYRGKAKTVFVTDEPNKLILEFRDDTSAFDGEKIEQLSRKGEVNNKFNHFIMQKLEAAGIQTQLEYIINDNESVVKKLSMIPVECVVRNYAAGSLCKRLGVQEGLALSPPTFELFLKNDALHDPMINESHCTAFGWATASQISQMKALTFQVNQVLSSLFDQGKILLVDFKLEFGTDDQGNIILGDEFTPDGCRLWDKETNKKLDKDRFRQGLGSVVESYIEVAARIGLDLR